jgi:hypothetical protein
VSENATPASKHTASGLLPFKEHGMNSRIINALFVGAVVYLAVRIISESVSS